MPVFPCAFSGIFTGYLPWTFIDIPLDLSLVSSLDEVRERLRPQLLAVCEAGTPAGGGGGGGGEGGGALGCLADLEWQVGAWARWQCGDAARYSSPLSSGGTTISPGALVDRSLAAFRAEVAGALGLCAGASTTSITTSSARVSSERYNYSTAGVSGAGKMASNTASDAAASGDAASGCRWGLASGWGLAEVDAALGLDSAVVDRAIDAAAAAAAAGPHLGQGELTFAAVDFDDGLCGVLVGGGDEDDENGGGGGGGGGGGRGDGDGGFSAGSANAALSGVDVLVLGLANGPSAPQARR